VRNVDPSDAINSKTPLNKLVAAITPSDLHYERSHAGAPNLDPAKHRLLIHGMARKSLALTVDDLFAMPSVSRCPEKRTATIATAARRFLCILHPSEKLNFILMGKYRAIAILMMLFKCYGKSLSNRSATCKRQLAAIMIWEHCDNM